MNHDITVALEAAVAGKPLATNQLFELVYDDLRRIAASRLKNEPQGHTLQATALVHEAYLRLLPAGTDSNAVASVPWENRRHFFAAAAEAMRRILIDNARRKSRIKHGGEMQKLSIDSSNAVIDMQVDWSDADSQLLDMDVALAAFEMADPKKAELVKLRYFAG